MTFVLGVLVGIVGTIVFFGVYAHRLVKIETTEKTE